MNHFIKTNSSSPPHPGGVVTRAPTDAQHDTAQPSVTSGFGAIIEKELTLQSATENSFGQRMGADSANLDRILHHQHSRLGANIALLEQRYEALPKPERFINWQGRGHPLAPLRHMPPEEVEQLPQLIAQHTRLLEDIDVLIGIAPDGQRGELILTEVSRSHEEMAWMLIALLKDDASTRNRAPLQNGERLNESTWAKENWDNEGGPVCQNQPAS